MTFFINRIKLTTIYAGNVGFSSSAGICLFHFAFYLNLGSKINVLLHLEISIHHQPAASGKITVWEIMREREKEWERERASSKLLHGVLNIFCWLLRYCASSCH